MNNTLYQLIMDSATSTIKLVVYVAVAILLVPWLKNSAIPWLKEKQLYGIVLRFVRAAEKLGNSGKIDKAAKLDYVIGMLAKRGITLTPEVRALIESAVYAVDEEIAKNIGTLLPEITTEATLEGTVEVEVDDNLISQVAEAVPAETEQKPVENMILEVITAGAEILANANTAAETVPAESEA